ncbi:cytochrome P450 [Streptomyces muensis]|uniref:Cytochrome P450 n=1 Tax=Streptomyces muensis TaxID=1077944 RepID=A0A9X1PXA0_STRM4|nr:cytochrome P450 [Streptomyces muensis]MCF1595202.1 cytochrome P450 [Streptomyces muensis]
MTSATSSEFVLTRPATAPLDPPPVYSRLRDEEPITRVSIWEGRLSAWLVTHWEDARAVLGNPAFSSDTSRSGFPTFIEDSRPAPRGFFANYDPPVHTTMRRTLTREFMVKKIDALRPAITDITRELLDEMTGEKGPVDFVERFALPLPSLVICELLGVPYEDHDFFQSHSKVFVDLQSTGEQFTASWEALNSYLLQLLTAKRSKPGDDVLTRLGEHVDTGAVSERDAADLAAFLLFAGHETTANMIALGTITLLQHPDQIPYLLAGPAEAANAVEELLRYLAIVHGGLRRYALEDVRIGDVTIRAGEGVIVPLHVANRDPEAFADPDRLDLGRANARQHVTFGYGIHQCLGQPLARAELQIVLPELFRRLPDLRIDVPLEDITFKQSTTVYGVHELPVTW